MAHRLTIDEYRCQYEDYVKRLEMIHQKNADLNKTTEPAQQNKVSRMMEEPQVLNKVAYTLHFLKNRHQTVKHVTHAR